jgi:sugar lactone lactonase YvrE
MVGNWFGTMLAAAAVLALGCEPAQKSDDKSAPPAAKTETQAPSAKGAAADPSVPLKQARALVQLPDYINAADGMCLMPDNSVLISAPNINDQKQPPWILRLTPDNKLEKFFDPIKHPDTGKAFPFGICVDPASGDVYYADLQWFAETKPNWKSRVVHIHMKDGKPTKATVLALGLIISNAVYIRNGYLYTTDTMTIPDSKPLVSSVFRFKLSEEPLEVKKPLEKDPHRIGSILTHHPKIPFGSDGLTFDSRGNMYVGNFADGTVHKFEFDAQGQPKFTPDKPSPPWAKAPFMKSCDCIFYDAKSDKIYVADAQANAVQIVSMDGSVQCLAQELTDDGANGKLDQPSEVLVRGDEVIVSNFDFPVEGGVNKHFEMPNFMSVIKLP